MERPSDETREGDLDTAMEMDEAARVLQEEKLAEELSLRQQALNTVSNGSGVSGVLNLSGRQPNLLSGAGEGESRRTPAPSTAPLPPPRAHQASGRSTVSAAAAAAASLSANGVGSGTSNSALFQLV